MNEFFKKIISLFPFLTSLSLFLELAQATKVYFFSCDFSSFFEKNNSESAEIEGREEEEEEEGGGEGGEAAREVLVRWEVTV